MKLIIIIIVFICMLTSTIFPACKKDSIPIISCTDKSNSIEIARELLPATYSWAYSVITYQGGSRVETPGNTGFNYKYVFAKNGSVLFYENDTLKSTDSYVIDYEFRATTYPLDSATIVIINDNNTNQRKEFFRPYLCTDSALFYNPYNSIDNKRYFKRN